MNRLKEPVATENDDPLVPPLQMESLDFNSTERELEMQSDSEEAGVDLGINHDCVKCNHLCLPHTSVNQDVASTRPDRSAERDEHAAVYETESPPTLPSILCPGNMDATTEIEQGDQGREVAEVVRA